MVVQARRFRSLRDRLTDREDVLERLRMADGQADIAAFDPASEKSAGRAVGNRYDASLDDERRLLQRIDQRAHVFAVMPHERISSGLSGHRSIRLSRSPLAEARGRPFEPRGEVVERRSEDELTEQADLVVVAVIVAADVAIRGVEEAVVRLLVLVDERDVDRRNRLIVDADVEIIVLQSSRRALTELRSASPSRSGRRR